MEVLDIKMLLTTELSLQTLTYFLKECKVLSLSSETQDRLLTVIPVQSS